MGEHDSSAFLKVLRREFDRIRSSWIYIFSLLILPLLSFAIVTAIFSRGVPRDLPIGVVDQDHSKLSREVVRSADATPIAATTKQFASRKAAYGAMQQGHIHAFLYIPQDAEKKAIRSEAPQMVLYIDNTNIVTGGLLRTGISKAIKTLSAGLEVQKLMKQGKSQTGAITGAMPVSIHDHVLFNPFGSYSYFLLTGLLPLMIVVFTFLTTTYAFGIELKEGTGPVLLQKAGGSIRIAMAAKMLPYTIVYLMNMFLVNYILFEYVDIPLRGSYGMIIISEFVMIVAYQLVALFLVSITSNLRLSLSLGSAYTMMALTFAGLTFPFDGMPVAARIFSALFPYRFWLDSFLSQTLRGEEIIYTIYPVYMVIIFIIIGLLSLPFLKRRMAEARFHGKL